MRPHGAPASASIWRKSCRQRLERPLVVEGAGGMLVPLNEESYVIDIAGKLGLPVILVARSTLGTINHTLLSLEALRRRGLAACRRGRERTEDAA